MKQNSRKIKRYIFAFILLILSAYATIYIKDVVDSYNPEKSLPILSVSTGYTMPYVVRAGYTWKFGNKVVRSPYIEPVDAPMVSYECDPNVNIVINFSAPYEKLSVYMADDLAKEHFVDLRYSNSTPIYTPSEPGTYVYKIIANFSKGDILYYFSITIEE